MIIAGNQIWDTCADCGKFIRVNKPVFGSLHFCLTDKERATKSRITASPPAPASPPRLPDKAR